MDKYFCKDCLGLWRQNKYMLCCPGCVGHRDSLAGWSPTLLLETYGPMFKVEERAYFPALVRLQLPPPRSPPHHVKPQVYKWLQTQSFLIGFVEQQTRCLKHYDTTNDPIWWEALDPIVQLYLQTLHF